MITKAQAMFGHEFHSGDCHRALGPRGGCTTYTVAWRATGKCQTWMRDRRRFRVPIKHGMFDSGYIADHSAREFHSAESCPLNDPLYITFVDAPRNIVPGVDNAVKVIAAYEAKVRKERKD